MANREIRDYPDYTGASNEGYLIVGGKTSNVSGGKILLSDIGGGGGGGSDVVYLDLTTQDIGNDTHLTAASMTPQQIISNIEAGKTVIARISKTVNNTIFKVVQLSFGDYYNGANWNDGYNIWFGPAGGSGANWGGYYVNIGTMMAGKLHWSSNEWDVSDLDEQ